MGRVFLVDLGSKTQYRCRFCESPLALKDDVLSWHCFVLQILS
ncbi:hypothetical protein SLEP1_g13594 [Rubroshorea leprosula]|uniref:Yippee domain-containing protein n=1 Tax=Rubroshorea leprosula TaxID=152421 RepID=A0AAV5IQW5_9ROSI|nr:hypothetical protein SLEP1_g13594 [Rubroshorea leprosula]